MARLAALRGAASLRERFTDWVMRHHRPAERELRLARRRVYILPTRHGYLFAALMVVLLLGATNYSNSLAFLLTFLLVSLGANAMWHTHRNLLDLRLLRGVPMPVFAGQEARIPLTLIEDRHRARPAIALRWREHDLSLADVPVDGSAGVELRVPALRRGRLHPGRVRVFTRYPLGLFEAWSWVEFELSVLVYPKPLFSERPLPTAVTLGGSGGRQARGSEDYGGLREYRQGDTPREIAWKAVARSGTLVTKEFSGEGREQTWLRWDALPELDVERRLSVLCGWVLRAEERGLPYGLSLPGTELAPAHGEAHRDRCLKALALFTGGG